MRILFELMGAALFAYLLFLGLNAWLKNRERRSSEQKELEDFRAEARKKQSNNGESQ